MNFASLLDRLINLSKLDDAQLAQLEADVVECFNELDAKPTDPDR